MLNDRALYDEEGNLIIRPLVPLSREGDVAPRRDTERGIPAARPFVSPGRYSVVIKVR
jgi:hypothetical protein